MYSEQTRKRKLKRKKRTAKAEAPLRQSESTGAGSLLGAFNSIMKSLLLASTARQSRKNDPPDRGTSFSRNGSLYSEQTRKRKLKKKRPAKAELPCARAKALAQVLYWASFNSIMRVCERSAQRVQSSRYRKRLWLLFDHRTANAEKTTLGSEEHFCGKVVYVFRANAKAQAQKKREQRKLSSPAPE